VALQATISLGEKAIEGDAIDLSMNGVFVQCDVSGIEGEDCRLILQSGPVHVEAAGEVVRRAGNGVALSFTEIIGMESFQHLKRLVLYNSPNPDQVLEESDHHIGIRPH